MPTNEVRVKDSPAGLYWSDDAGLSWYSIKSRDIPADSELAVMVRHYIIAALWADAPEGTNPRASNSAKATAAKDCAEFIAHIGPERMQRIRDAYADGYGTHPDCGNESPWMAALGHDFWLSRNGHGTGFFDRDALPKDLRDWLQDAARDVGEAYPEFWRGWMFLR